MKEASDQGRYHLDDVDWGIVAALKEDGRMSFAEIARRLDVSAGMVRQRYLDLADKGILQVVAVTNPTLLGYNTMALVGVRVDGHRLREIAHEMAAFGEVVYLVLCSGTFDILVEVACRDNAHLLQFLTDHLRAIEGVVHTETIIYLEIVKETYI
jgi:Lrp/AsnC family transcriptional regulator for asnA, asnC and gidA